MSRLEKTPYNIERYFDQPIDDDVLLQFGHLAQCQINTSFRNVWFLVLSFKFPIESTSSHNISHGYGNMLLLYYICIIFFHFSNLLLKIEIKSILFASFLCYIV